MTAPVEARVLRRRRRHPGPRPRPRYRVWRGGPVPPGSDAITLWSLIIVRRRAADDEQLMRHEAVHVDQWRAFGVFGFLRRYVGSYLWWRTWVKLIYPERN